MRRDRFATRAAILESAAEMVAAEGVGALGVNGLAEAARCDKVLIYRYFGGLDGVLETLGVERMLWPRVAVGGDDGGETLADAVQAVLLEEWAALSGGTLMLEAGAAEMMRGNSLGAATAAQRSAHHAEVISELRERYRVPPYVDLAALIEILSAALSVFALRAAHASGVAPSDAVAATPALDPGTPAGWRRIEKTLAAMTRAMLESDGR
jgi:AcrR family transcriptional regulator